MVSTNIISPPGSSCSCNGHKCPHYWVGEESAYEGTTFRCKHCRSIQWLPFSTKDIEALTILIKEHGSAEGYYEFLSAHANIQAYLESLPKFRRKKLNVK